MRLQMQFSLLNNLEKGKERNGAIARGNFSFFHNWRINSISVCY